MDTTELAAIKARVEKAQATVQALCDREIGWVMSVPARPESDPDLVISDSLKDVGTLVGEVERLAAEADTLADACQRVHQWLSAKWERPLSGAEGSILAILEEAMRKAGVETLSIIDWTAGSEEQESK